MPKITLDINVCDFCHDQHGSLGGGFDHIKKRSVAQCSYCKSDICMQCKSYSDSVCRDLGSDLPDRGYSFCGSCRNTHVEYGDLIPRSNRAVVQADKLSYQLLQYAITNNLDLSTISLSDVLRLPHSNTTQRDPRQEMNNVPQEQALINTQLQDLDMRVLGQSGGLRHLQGNHAARV